MADTADYEFQGYYDDDARMIHDILEKEWDEDVLKDKVLLYFDESKDISSVNFNRGELAIKIYADEVENEPMGIGFDSITSDRYMHLEVRTIDRDLYIGAIDEISRILVKYRLRPGNTWDTMWLDAYERRYPAEKFYHGVLTVHLKKYCHTLPLSRDGWINGNVYY